jgi:hypothetical protein
MVCQDDFVLTKDPPPLPLLCAFYFITLFFLYCLANAYFWFDLFTNDQNNVVGKDFDWFCTTFRGSIQRIGQVLLVMAPPWNDPIPVKRGWCLFEIASTLDMAAAGVKLVVKLPAAERAGLEARVRKDAKCILQCMADIQAEKAEAFSKEELEMIF